MLSDKPRVREVLEREIIGFITAVNGSGQPQTSPVWYVLDGDDIVVYSQPGSPRLGSIAVNPRVSFNLRGDPRAEGVLTMEGTAQVEETLPPAQDFPGYVAKYGEEIERLGWTPESFSSDYSVGLRLVVTRVRAWGLEELSR